MTTKEIIDLPTDAWIILHTWPSTYDWYGSCPCEPHDFFVTKFRSSNIPLTFDSKEDAEKYIKENYLSEHWTKVVQIAGKEIESKPVIQCSHEWATLLSGEYKCMKCGAKE